MTLIVTLIINEVSRYLYMLYVHVVFKFTVRMNMYIFVLTVNLNKVHNFNSQVNIVVLSSEIYKVPSMDVSEMINIITDLLIHSQYTYYVSYIAKFETLHFNHLRQVGQVDPIFIIFSSKID